MSTQQTAGPDHDVPASGRTRAPLYVERMLFLGLTIFFIPIAFIYGYLTDFMEPVGFIGILLVSGLAGLVVFYLYVTARSIDPRPEDDPLGEIEQGSGEYGTFSPHSWWPLVLGAACAVIFLGVAVGWWVSVIGAILGLIGLVGLLMEFSRGHYAH